MFDNLIESAPKKRGIRGMMTTGFMSVVFHTVFIGAAIWATNKAAEQVAEILMDTTMVFIEEEEPEPEPEPQVATLNPPPKGFQVLTAPIEIPKEIPPIDLSQRFDPRDYSGIGVEGGVFSGIEGGTGPVDLSQVFNEAVVDEIPARISCPDLEYPRMMQQANIEGTVLMQFIVDREGGVERGSANVMNSSHRAFEGPARTMVGRCRFRPGRVRGKAVRVLVQMPVNFVLTGGP